MTLKNGGTSCGYVGPGALGTGNQMSVASAGALPLLFGTNSSERFRIASNGAWGLSGANYGTSGQVLTSNGSGSAPTWQSSSGGVTKAQSIAFSLVFGL